MSGQQPPDRLQISAVQVIASSLAAVAAAVVCSFFGVAGTIIGTAVASACATVGSAMFAHSLRRASQRFRGGRVASLPWTARLRALPWRRVALGSGAAFLLSAVVITLIELGAGGSLASLLHGGDSRGTFIPGTTAPDRPQRHHPTGSASATASPTPSTTPTSTPSVSPTPTPTPSGSPSPTPSPSSPPPNPISSLLGGP